MIHSYHRVGYGPARWREHAHRSSCASSGKRARTHVKRSELGLAALAGAATACLGGWGGRAGRLRPAADSVLALVASSALNQYVRVTTTRTARRLRSVRPPFSMRSTTSTGATMPIRDLRFTNSRAGRMLDTKAREARSPVFYVFSAPKKSSAWHDGGNQPRRQQLGERAAKARGRNSTTVAEHTSNLLPWRLAADATGAKVRCVDVDEEGRISLQDLEGKLGSTHALFVQPRVERGGISIPPPRSARVRIAGARVFVDAAQSAPHMALDVQAMGCDFLAFSRTRCWALWASAFSGRDGRSSRKCGRIRPDRDGREADLSTETP